MYLLPRFPQYKTEFDSDQNIDFDTVQDTHFHHKYPSSCLYIHNQFPSDSTPP